MKKIFAFGLLLTVVSCSGTHKEETKKTKIICGDSIDTEMFDQNGVSFMVKVPGKCDTVVVEH